MLHAEVRRISTEVALVLCKTPEEADRLSVLLFATKEPWLRGVARGAETILIEHSARIPPNTLEDLLSKVQFADDTRSTNLEGPDAAETLEIPTLYDGEDLSAVAESLGLTRADVIQLHADAIFTVSFVGFGAGFGYLAGLPQELQLPRRATPRKEVPSGSVAIAGQYSGVYPRPTPGGWHLLGRTDLPIWDPERDPPGMFRAGLRVRFVPVATSPARTTQSLSAQQPLAHSNPAVEAEDAGAVSVGKLQGVHTLQDLGRPDAGKFGLSRSGAIDSGALRRANRLVGNEEADVCIEIGPFPLTLLFRESTLVAATGASRLIRVGASTEGIESPFVVPAGEVVEFGTSTQDMYTYLACGGGGFFVRKTLGSGSYDSLSEFGPPPLEMGMRLALRKEPLGNVHTDLAPVRHRPEVVRFVAGPHSDWFVSESIRTFESDVYAVANEVNRVGVRLNGPRLQRRRTEELPPEPMIPGYIQVPPNGEPVVLLRDHGATGGYPVVGLVLPEDLWIVGQTPPGQKIRFRRVNEVRQR